MNLLLLFNYNCEAGTGLMMRADVKLDQVSFDGNGKVVAELIVVNSK